MNKILLISLLVFTVNSTANAQRGWGFLKGEPSKTFPIYGTKGIPHLKNTPGIRTRSATWTLNGKLYLYGGAIENPDFPADMWAYDTLTKNWTWLCGTKKFSEPPIYGIKGVEDSTNSPGSRRDAATWVLNNKLYLFGGEVNFNGSANSFADDLWEYNPTTGYWTWLSGNVNNKYSRYGAQGVSSPTNKPSASKPTASWVYNDKLYMFGGEGFDSLNSGHLNDIWEYDLNTGYWTWIKGSKKIVYNPANWGVKNVSSSTTMPGSQSSTTSWFLDSCFYLFGSRGGYDEMLEFNMSTNNWTWIKGGDTLYQSPHYGIKNIADSTNTPGTSAGSITWTNNGKLYVYGGVHTIRPDPNEYVMEHLWEFDVSTKNWTWVGGSKQSDKDPNFGTKNHTHSSVWPGAIDNYPHLIWKEASKVFLSYRSDAIWEYSMNTKQWRWVKGMHNPYSKSFYVQPKVADILNEPSNLESKTCWQVGDTAYLYSYDISLSRNIMWRYDLDKNLWTVIKINKDPTPTYGVKGMAARDNNPGAIVGASTWHANGKLFLYGGRNFNKLAPGLIWEFDLVTNNWRWIKGDTSNNCTPVYGTKGIANANNTPGCRFSTVSWSYNGKFYLFGGNVMNIRRNDVWEYNPATNNWRWIKGSNLTSQLGVYGAKGIVDTANTPGSRSEATSVQINNKLFVFGGVSYIRQNIGTGYYNANDLWEYDFATNNWRWLSGDTTRDPPSVFGIKGVPDTANTPGGRHGGVMWGLNNKIYLFGGYGTHVWENGWLYPLTGFLDDIWQYDISTGLWAWIDGSDIYGRNGFYDVPLVKNSANRPGAFDHRIAMTKDNLLITLDEKNALISNIDTNFTSVNNAMWYYDVCDSPQLCYPNPPVINIDSVISLCDNRNLVLNAGNIGCTYLWSNGDTLQSTVVTSPGKYWVKVTNPANKTSTDTVLVVSAIAPAVSLGGDTTICDNDSIILNALSQGATYYWSTGATTPQITVNKTGTYSVSIIDKAGCYDNPSISIKTKSAPKKINLGSNSPICVGNPMSLKDSNIVNRNNMALYGPNGRIPLSSNYTSYGIVNASTTDSGVYYMIDTTNGCFESDTIVIEVYKNFTPAVDIAVSPGVVVWPFVQMEFQAKVKYDAVHSTYQWYKNGNLLQGETNNIYKAIAQTQILENDIVCVKVKNTNICALIDTSTGCTQPVNIKLSVNDINYGKDVLIYPNPVNDLLHIKGTSGRLELQITDLLGRLIQKYNITDSNIVLDVKSLEAGVYFVKLISINKDVITAKFVKE